MYFQLRSKWVVSVESSLPRAKTKSQCDQMLFQNLDRKCPSTLRWYFRNSQKVTKYLGYFCKKKCFQELSKCGQSGLTTRSSKSTIVFPANENNISFRKWWRPRSKMALTTEGHEDASSSSSSSHMSRLIPGEAVLLKKIKTLDW